MDNKAKMIMQLAQSGNAEQRVSSMLNQMDDSKKQQLQSLLNDKEQMQKILSNSEVQRLLKALQGK